MGQKHKTRRGRMWGGGGERENRGGSFDLHITNSRDFFFLFVEEAESDSLYANMIWRKARMKDVMRQEQEGK